MESTNNQDKPKTDLISPGQAKVLLEKMGNPPSLDSPYLRALRKISEGEESLPLGETIRSFTGEGPRNWRKVGRVLKQIRARGRSNPNPK